MFESSTSRYIPFTIRGRSWREYMITDYLNMQQELVVSEWGTPKKWWVSMLQWSNDSDDFGGYPHGLGNPPTLSFLNPPTYLERKKRKTPALNGPGCWSHWERLLQFNTLEACYIKRNQPYGSLWGVLKMGTHQSAWLFQYQVMVIHDDWMNLGYPHDVGSLHILNTLKSIASIRRAPLRTADQPKNGHSCHSFRAEVWWCQMG